MTEQQNIRADHTGFRLATVLWGATTLFIVYGTLIPFDFTTSLSVVSEHLARVSLNPLVSPDTGRRVSIPDVAQNLLLFIPFGLFGVWTLKRPRRMAARVALVTCSPVL